MLSYQRFGTLWQHASKAPCRFYLEICISIQLLNTTIENFPIAYCVYSLLCLYCLIHTHREIPKNFPTFRDIWTLFCLHFLSSAGFFSQLFHTQFSPIFCHISDNFITFLGILSNNLSSSNTPTIHFQNQRIPTKLRNYIVLVKRIAREQRDNP